MNLKVIPLPAERKQPALSKLMIVSLIEAGVKQHRGIPFGPADIKGGSFGALIKRGLVVHVPVSTKNHTESLWQLTPQAFAILRNLGVDFYDNF